MVAMLSGEILLWRSVGQGMDDPNTAQDARTGAPSGCYRVARGDLVVSDCDRRLAACASIVAQLMASGGERAAQCGAEDHMVRGGGAMSRRGRGGGHLTGAMHYESDFDGLSTMNAVMADLPGLVRLRRMTTVLQGRLL